MKKVKFEALSLQQFEKVRLQNNQLKAITGGDCASLYANETRKDTICDNGTTEFDNGTTSTGDPQC